MAHIAAALAPEQRKLGNYLVTYYLVTPIPCDQFGTISGTKCGKLLQDNCGKVRMLAQQALREIDDLASVEEEGKIQEAELTQGNFMLWYGKFLSAN